MALNTSLTLSKTRAGFSRVDLTPTTSSKDRNSNNYSDISMLDILLFKLKEAIRVAIPNKFNRNRKNLILFLL